MPEQIKKSAEEKFAELEKEFTRLSAQVQRNRDLIASNDERIKSNRDLIESNKARVAAFDALKKSVDANRASITELMKKAPAEFVKHEGAWKKALKDWEDEMRMFGQT